MIYQETLPLSQHDVLDSSECGQALDRLLELRDRWTTRGAGNFYTLGAASYLDATPDRVAYLQAAKVANPVLHTSFAWLHERVRSFFEELLEEPVYFNQDAYALPGFHIFSFKGEDRSHDDVAARAHFDLQWMHAIPNHYLNGTLSFTLPIEEPTGGSSMAIWHVRYQEAVELGFAASAYAAKHTPQIVTYAPGRVVVHDGFVLHAIGKSAVRAPNGMRVTMQGHGVRMNDGWLLYW